jgi:NADH-quinone oxidoreductase subunit M
MLSHGFTSAGLFLLAGILYKMYHTKNILYFSGLNQGMPLFSFFFIFFCFSNGAFPGTFNFLGELFLILGVLNKSVLLAAVFISISSLLAIYFVWFAGRIIFGEINNNFFNELKDLTLNQIVVLSTLTILIIYFGIFSNSIIFFLII